MDAFERLNDINQRIWDNGFTASNIKELNLIAEDIKNGAAVFERIPHAQQSGLSKGSEVLCAASIICRGCPRTESETRQIFDTSDLEGEGRIQEHLVETWARLSGKWIENPEYVNTLSKQARNLVIERYSQTIVWEHLLNAYHEISTSK